MTTLATQSQAQLMESVLIGGNLEQLSPADRVMYYKQVCESIGLNPVTKPFEYIKLNGKLTLYAKRDATDQLRKIHGVSIVKLERDNLQGVYVVTAYAKDKDGREDSSTGAVPIENLKGDNLANALMKAETKAKRRVTLSICGLGMLDETELETIPQAAQEPVEAVQVAARATAQTQTATEQKINAQPAAEGVTEDMVAILREICKASKLPPTSWLEFLAFVAGRSEAYGKLSDIGLEDVEKILKRTGDDDPSGGYLIDDEMALPARIAEYNAWLESDEHLKGLV